MPVSDNNETAADIHIAVIAEALYLINLLLVPGLAFLILIVLYRRHIQHCSMICRCHLRQTLIASIWAGVLIMTVTGVILLWGDYREPWTWVVLIIYFVTIHATLVLLGVVGLARAQSGKHYHYPLIGPACPLQVSS